MVQWCTSSKSIVRGSNLPVVLPGLDKESAYLKSMVWLKTLVFRGQVEQTVLLFDVHHDHSASLQSTSLHFLAGWCDVEPNYSPVGGPCGRRLADVSISITPGVVVGLERIALHRSVRSEQPFGVLPTTSIVHLHLIIQGSILLLP